MKPYFQNNRVTLYCGDSREVLAFLQSQGEHFDLLLTDPPYGLNQAEKPPSGVNAKLAKGKYADNLFKDTPEYLKTVVRAVIDKSLELSTLGIVAGGVGCWKYLPPPDEEGCIYMPAAPSFNSWSHCDFRPLFYYGKPKGNIGKYRKLSHTLTEGAFCKEHPCSKPLTFWKKLMLCGTDGIENKRVLDPFGGSGTTGRAAMDLGMHAVLIELNPRYCDLIVRNLAQDTLF